MTPCHGGCPTGTPAGVPRQKTAARPAAKCPESRPLCWYVERGGGQGVLRADTHYARTRGDGNIGVLPATQQEHPLNTAGSVANLNTGFCAGFGVRFDAPPMLL